ncbi:MAG TPA: RNA-binding cell elongation regulator Jag/EloR [Gaiellaceae bacterium]
MSSDLQTEATGETVGEAKWQALRELERLSPGLDKSLVRFQVLSEGERGLLGVGYRPARVIASVPEGPQAAPAAPPADESELAARVRELVERATHAMGLSCRIDIHEDEESVTASCSGSELGLLIGKRGQTIDALQYLANAIVYRAFGEGAKQVVIDAARYRERRKATLETLALQAAERVRAGGDPVGLEPMTSIERKVVHLRLKDEPGVGTESEGVEPNRYVVVVPASAPADSP